MSNYSEIAIPLGSPFMRNRGLHNSVNSYKALDFVTDGKGSTYVCLRDLIPGVPLVEGADWAFIAKGAYQAWLEIEGNEDKSFSNFIDWIREPVYTIIEGIENDEAIRNANELIRVNRENIRVNNEDLRNSKEAERLINEGDQNSGRIKNELDRQAAEISRNDNEIIRVNNELLRNQDEIIRGQNEIDRGLAEDVREIVKQEMIDERLISEELNDHPPILMDVSGRQLWHYWNLISHSYISTGLPGAFNFVPNNLVSYQKYDVVQVNGTSYISLINNNTSPIQEGTNWKIIAKVGRTPQFEIGEVTTTEEGTYATVTITLTGYDTDQNPQYTVDYSIPRGNTGKSAYDVYEESGGTLGEGAFNTLLSSIETVITDAELATNLANEVATHPPIITGSTWHYWDTSTDAYVDTNIAATPYESYLQNTTDDPVLTEAEWSLWSKEQGDFAKEQGELAQTARENIEGDLALKIDKSSITSELGDSEELVMSQKAVKDELTLKADLVDGTVPAEQLPPELVDTTLYVTNVAHRKRRIKDASEVEDSTALWTLVKGSDYLKALPDILGLGLYLVSQDLTEHKKLSKTNSNFYADGTPAALDGSEGDIQMCWRKPIYIKYYEKQEADGLYEHFEISHLNILGDCEMIPPGGGFPAVLDRTTTTLRALYSTDANYRGGNNASSYDADPLKTLLGKPASNFSAYTSELYAKKRGDLWTSGGTPFFATLAILQIMFFGTNNSQAAIVSDDLLVDGAGFQRSKIATEGLFEGSFGVYNAFPNWDTYNAYNPTFDLSAGFEYGDITGRRVYTIPDWPTAGTTQTIQLAYFFGMPWPFNHMWYGDAHQRVDQQTVEQGFKTVVYQKRDITTAPISGGPSSNGVIPPAPWEKVAEAYRSNGYIRRVSWNGLSMIPTEAGGAGGASTFYCDYLYNNGETSFGWRAPLRFAPLHLGSLAGAFYVNVYITPALAYANSGAFCCHFTEGIAPRKIEKSFS